MSETEGLLRPRRGSAWLGLALSGVGGLLCWAAWMGWDLHYDIDPVTGNESGPYEQWQIIGSALSLLIVVVIVSLLMRLHAAFVAYALIAATYTLGFCVSANITSNLNPETGASFWPIGAALLFLGAGAGIFATGLLTSLLRQAAARRGGRSRGQRP